MTSTFFPDGSLDREWVDTSLRMVDLRTEGAALARAPRQSRFHSLRSRRAAERRRVARVSRRGADAS